MKELLPIAIESVAENHRLAFLPKHLGQDCLKFEKLVYQIMSIANAKYDGGFWEFFDLSNDSFFIAPLMEGKQKLVWEDNYFSGELSPQAAGIAVSLMALSWITIDNINGLAGEKFLRLREYALDHAEAGKIFGFID